MPTISVKLTAEQRREIHDNPWRSNAYFMSKFNVSQQTVSRWRNGSPKQKRWARLTGPEAQRLLELAQREGSHVGVQAFYRETQFRYPMAQIRRALKWLQTDPLLRVDTE